MLLLRRADYDDLRRHGEETYPNECCGILLGLREGSHRIVREIRPCENARTDSPHNRYSIDVRDLIHAQRDAHERGLDIVGFYHSHPDHPAMWTQTDFTEAHWIGCSYVITSIAKGQATQTNSFVLEGTREEDKAFAAEEVVIVS